MTQSAFINQLHHALKHQSSVHTSDEREVLQSLWSGYGEIARYRDEISGKSVIVKSVAPSHAASHPRGWGTSLSHQRKLSSYHNEQQFYAKYAAMTNAQCRVPHCYVSGSQGDRSWLILEDLDASGFAERCLSPNQKAIDAGLDWLANFHACFLNVSTPELWPQGNYWHLNTRPDEWDAMPEGPLKDSAVGIDRLLSECQFKTLLHGDAKVANFCFDANWNQLAAVDFQYVGQGCGIQDVVYFLGSCLSGQALELQAEALYECYFTTLQNASKARISQADWSLLESQWRALIPFAWADFERFLIGWSPGHKKLSGYSARQTQMALKQLV